MLRRAGIDAVVADRTLPLIFADQIQKARIFVQCDWVRGVLWIYRKSNGCDVLNMSRKAPSVLRAKRSPGRNRVMMWVGCFVRTRTIVTTVVGLSRSLGCLMLKGVKLCGKFRRGVVVCQLP